jgi:hypothetical protein
MVTAEHAKDLRVATKAFFRRFRVSAAQGAPRNYNYGARGRHRYCSRSLALIGISTALSGE